MFCDLTRKVNINNYEEIVVNINQIKAQYNPDRFKFWKLVYEGHEKEILNMLYSPHYRFLDLYIKNKGEISNIVCESSYYILQSFYGRSYEWIMDKIFNFINLFHDIYFDGYKDRIIILNKPLVQNKYNTGFEIFEGHHRVACCLAAGMMKMSCKLVCHENY